MYNIKLNNFEGPLDLLLFFIKRDEIDIYDIPISSIAKEFLDYVRLMELLDLELAGEFVVMASALVHIKAQMLLPRTPLGIEGEHLEEEDPRVELVRKLLEYKRYKEAAEYLGNRASTQKYVYYRQMFDAERVMMNVDDGYRNATLFDLLRALKKAFDRSVDSVAQHVVEKYSFSVEEVSDTILKELSNAGSILFSTFLKEKPRAYIVVTFLAILELIKNLQISIHQYELFDDIKITSRRNPNQELN